MGLKKKKKSVINNPLTHSVIYPNQMAKYLKAKKKKKKKKTPNREKLKEVRLDAERERERSEGTSTASTSMELADRPDLAPVRNRGQRQQRAEQRVGGLRSGNLRCGFRDFSGLLFHKINGIGKSKFVISFFFFFSPLVCWTCWREAKKRDTCWTPESSELYPFWCPTPTRRQKWRVRAT